MKYRKNFIIEGIIYCFVIFLTLIPFLLPKSSPAFSSDAGISASREFNTTEAATGEAITVIFRLDNVSDSIKGFYFADHIPSDFTVVNT